MSEGLGFLPDMVAGGVFAPKDLFAPLSVGAYYDFTAASTRYQERLGAAATTPAGVGDPVGSVADLSGNGHWLTAPADLNRPAGAADGLDGDGVDDYLLADLGTAGYAQGDLTLFAVGRLGLTGNWEAFCFCGDATLADSATHRGNPAIQRILLLWAVGAHNSWVAATAVSVACTIGDPMAVIYRRTGGTSGNGGAVAIDIFQPIAGASSATGTQTWTSGTSSKFSVMAQSISPLVARLGGVLSAAGVVNRAISDVERDLLMAWLVDRMPD